MEALVELHDNIMYYLVAILFVLGYPGLEWSLHNPPKPYAFTSLLLQIMLFPFPGWNKPVELRGIDMSRRMTRSRMSLHEQWYHLEAELDYYLDRLETNPNPGVERKIIALKKEIEEITEEIRWQLKVGLDDYKDSTSPS
jgi:hypothetical protein